MNFFARRQWDLPQRQHTSESVYENRGLHRREKTCPAVAHRQVREAAITRAPQLRVAAER